MKNSVLFGCTQSFTQGGSESFAYAVGEEGGLVENLFFPTRGKKNRNSCIHSLWMFPYPLITQIALLQPIVFEQDA